MKTRLFKVTGASVMGVVYGILSWGPEEGDQSPSSTEDLHTTGTGYSSLVRRNVPRRSGADLYDDQKADEVIRIQTSSNTDERCSTVNQRYADGQTPLTFAIRQQELEQVRALLADPEVDVNFPELRRYTMYSSVTASPLIVAAQTQQLNIVQLLLEAGADVNALNEIGSSALHMAAEQGSEEGVQLLLQYKASLHWDLNKDDPLHRACRNGHQRVVNILVTAGSNVDPPKSSAIICPLSLALEHKHDDIALYLLQHGAKFEHHSQEDPTTRKPTVFLQACRMGSPRIVKYLIDAGVDREVSDGKYASAFHYAIRNGDLARITRGRTPYSSDDQDLRYAHAKLKQVYLESVAVFEMLCEAGGDLEPVFGACDREYTNCALLNALSCWNIPACLVLLKHGAAWEENIHGRHYSATILFHRRARQLFALDPDLYTLLYDHAPRSYIFETLDTGFKTEFIDNRSSEPFMFPVPSLKQCCRRTIRDCVKTPARICDKGGYMLDEGSSKTKSILPTLLRLPLPRPLLDYLCYSKLDFEQLISNLSESYLNHVLFIHR